MLLWRIYAAGNNKTQLALHVNWPIFLADFKPICSSSTYCRIFMKVSVSNFTKICLVAVALIHADGETDRRTEGRTKMTELIGALRESMRTRLKWRNSKLSVRFICLTIQFLNYGMRRGLRVFWNGTLTVSNFAHLNSLGSDVKHRRTIFRIIVFMLRIVGREYV